jgi:hypothetical protein
MVYFERFNQIDWTFQKNKIVNLSERFNTPKIIIDSTGIGDAIFDDLRNAGLFIEGYLLTNKSKATLIQKLSLSFDNKEIGILDEPVLLGELEMFGYDITKMGNIRYNAPEGFHDDCVISLALGNYLLQDKKTVTITWI